MSAHPVHDLTEAADQAELEYLLIGGYAVIAYGSRRVTTDVDLLVPEPQRAA